MTIFPHGNGDDTTNGNQAVRPHDIKAPVLRVQKDTADPDQVLEAALQEAVRAEAELSGPGDSDAMDMEDFYGPETPKPASEAIAIGNDDLNQRQSCEPELLITPIPKPDGHNAQDQALIPDVSPVAQDEESDDYEPAEAASPSAPFSTAITQTSNSDAIIDTLEVRDEGEITDEAQCVPVTNETEMAVEQIGERTTGSQLESAMDTSEFSVDEDTITEPMEPQSSHKMPMLDDDVDADDALPQSCSAPVLTEVKNIFIDPLRVCADDI